MPQFMDVHSGFKGVSHDQLHAAHQEDLELEGSEGVHFIRAWADPESGKVFCLSSASPRVPTRRR